NALDRTIMPSDEHGFSIQPAADLLGQFSAAELFNQLTLQSDRARIGRLQTTGDAPAHQLCQLDVDAELGVHIQWQVVSDQVDAIFQQGADATLFQAGDGSRLATPEVAMMHQQQVRTGFGGGVDKCLTGGDATDHSTDLATPFHLQTIRAVILKGSRFEEIVAV